MIISSWSILEVFCLNQCAKVYKYFPRAKFGHRFIGQWLLSLRTEEMQYPIYGGLAKWCSIKYTSVKCTFLKSRANMEKFLLCSLRKIIRHDESSVNEHLRSLLHGHLNVIYLSSVVHKQCRQFYRSICLWNFKSRYLITCVLVK
jgi:hypothetical protein